MSRIIKILRKIKRNYKRFKENECGGDILNNILILVVTIIIIAMLIAFAITQIENIASNIKDLVKEYSHIKMEITILGQDIGIFNSEYLINEFIYPKDFLIWRL